MVLEVMEGDRPLFGVAAPKPIKWVFQNQGFYIGSEVGIWANLRHGELYVFDQINGTRIHLDQVWRQNMLASGRDPPPYKTYLITENQLRLRVTEIQMLRNRLFSV